MFLDEVLEQEPLTGGGNDLKALRMLLETRGLRYEVVKINQESLGTLNTTGRDAVVIMDNRKRQQVERDARIMATGAVEASPPAAGTATARSGSRREWAWAQQRDCRPFRPR